MPNTQGRRLENTSHRFTAAAATSLVRLDGAKEIIYMGAKTFMALMDTGQFSIRVNEEPTPKRREAADRTWGNARGTAAGDDLPQPPHAWLRQLHDDLRTFGSG